MKEQILNLRKEGRSYRYIMNTLGCSASTVAYHCCEVQNRKAKARTLKSDTLRINRAIERRKELIRFAGGCCVKCGYDKNYAALEFHHENPAEKEFEISTLSLRGSMEKIKKEIEKCLLLCCRCHREIHNPDKEIGL